MDSYEQYNDYLVHTGSYRHNIFLVLRKPKELGLLPSGNLSPQVLLYLCCKHTWIHSGSHTAIWGRKTVTDALKKRAYIKDSATFLILSMESAQVATLHANQGLGDPPVLQLILLLTSKRNERFAKPKSSVLPRDLALACIGRDLRFSPGSQNNTELWLERSLLKF